ncbi:hypothetical protein BU230_11510, partial [Klebsiella pneumoniae]
MSFASETKKELTNLEMKECCEKAELSALLLMNGAFSFPNRSLPLQIQSDKSVN